MSGAVSLATPLTRKIARFSRLLTVLILALAVLTFLLGMLRGQEAGQMFMAAIAHYADTQIVPMARVLGPAGTLAADLSAFFEAVVDLATRDSRTPGCLISCVLADAAGSNDRFRQELDRRFAALENRIAQRVSQDGGVPAADIPAMAGMLAAVVRGIMLRARSGTTAADLSPVAAVAVRAAVTVRGG